MFAAIASIVAGCATKPENVKATYVSPNVYSFLECEPLLAERERVIAKVAQVSQEQNDKAANDAIATGVGVVLFLPALVFLAAGDDRETELASLKGNYDALTKAAARANCLSADELQAETAVREAALKAYEEEVAARRAQERPEY